MNAPKRLAVGTSVVGVAGCAACCVAPVVAVAATAVFAPVAGAAAITAAAMTVSQRRNPGERSASSSMDPATTSPGSRSLRAALAVLLVASAGLFLFGAVREHSMPHHETRSEAVPETGVETPAEHHGESTTEGRVFGLDLEAWPFIITAIIVSIALAILTVALQSPWPIVAAGIVATVFAVFDVAEVVHQIRDSQWLLAGVAIGVTALHAAVLGLVVLLTRRSLAA
jgi:hypothetical protein